MPGLDQWSGRTDEKPTRPLPERLSGSKNKCLYHGRTRNAATPRAARRCEPSWSSSISLCRMSPPPPLAYRYPHPCLGAVVWVWLCAVLALFGQASSAQTGVCMCLRRHQPLVPLSLHFHVPLTATSTFVSMLILVCCCSRFLCLSRSDCRIEPGFIQDTLPLFCAGFPAVLVSLRSWTCSCAGCVDVTVRCWGFAGELCHQHPRRTGAADPSPSQSRC